MSRSPILSTLLPLFALAGVPACAEPELVSALDETEAALVAEDMLTALDAGDREAYVADFSDAMREAVDEEVFAWLHTTIGELSGEFRTVDAATLQDARTPGYVTWVIDTTFSKEPVTVEMVYATDGVLVEGIQYYSENIDAAQ